MFRVALNTSVQVIASLGTVGLTVGAAQRCSAQEFGRFALSSALVVICVGLVRAFTAEPLIYREKIYARVPEKERRFAAASGAVIVSVVITVGMASILLLVSRDATSALLVASIALTSSWQDFGRVVMVAAGKSRAAVTIEGISTAVMAALVLASAHTRGAQSIYLAWLVASALSAALSACVLRIRLRRRQPLIWLRLGWRKGLAYAVDFGMTSGLAQATLFIATLIAGVGAAGSIRGAQVLLMPVALMTRGMLTALVPEVVRLAQRDSTRGVMRVAHVFAITSVFAAAATAAAGLLVPSAWLIPLLGDSTRSSLGVLPWSALASATLALAMAPGLVMRAYGAVAQVALSKVIVAPIALLLMALGTMTYGAAGTQAALAGGNALRAVLTQRQLKLLRRST